MANNRTKTTEQFIEEAIEVHGDKYDYSMVEYIHSKTKVKIICPKHGEFKQTAGNHLQSNGCKKCSLDKRTKTAEQFIEKAIKVHGDKYDYYLNEYVVQSSKIKIVCPEHGEFEQRAFSHLEGKGCKKCNLDKRTKTTEQFIEKAREVHGDKYDYSLVDYVQIFSKVKIICPEHGEFEQRASGHLNSRGCKYCARYSNWHNKAKKSKYFDSFKVYFVKLYDNDGEVFYKIGVTYSKLKKRFTSIPYKYEIINVKEIKDINDKKGAEMIFELESRFKKIYKNKRYTPNKEFSGMGECFYDKIN